MKHTSSHFSGSVFRRVFAVWRRMVKGKADVVQTRKDFSQSYVGLFQGVVETAERPAASTPAASHPAANASGFLRLEVDKQKKTTGCLMLFVDGRVLTGAVEGAAERTGGFGTAHCRLDKEQNRQPGESRPTPMAAVGHIQLQGRSPQPKAGGHLAASREGQKVTIRFI